MIFFSKNNSFDNKTLWDFLKIIHLIEISFRKINDKKCFFCGLCLGGMFNYSVGLIF